MKIFKAIVFDMDGVIVDSEPLWEKSERIFMHNMGLEYNPLYRDKILGLNQKDSALLLRDTFNLKISIGEIIEERLKILLQLYKNELKLIDGIEKILSESLNENLKVGLASSSPMNIIEFVLNKFEIKKYFHSLVSGECTENGKPDPDIYIEAAKRLGTEPEKCIAVEDSINGVISAKNAGMYCVAVPDKRLPLDGYRLADVIVDNISEISLGNLV